MRKNFGFHPALIVCQNSVMVPSYDHKTCNSEQHWFALKCLSIFDLEIGYYVKASPLAEIEYMGNFDVESNLLVEHSQFLRLDQVF